MSLKTQSFQFGDFDLDLEERVLFCNETPVSITPKAFLLLQTLIERRGHLVEKQELMTAVWADSFVEQGNLTFTVNLLRKVLGDSSKEPQFIETVPRRGYRFIADVTEKFPEVNANRRFGNPRVHANTSRRRRSPLAQSVFLVLGLGIVLAASWYTVGKYNRARTSAPIFAVPFESEPFSTSGNVAHAVISRDGKHVVYSIETGVKQNVWLRNLETSENVQLIPPSDDHYLGFAFSRSGSTLFFVRKPSDDSAPSAVYRMAAFGGIPAKIIDKAEGWISVSPDDQFISFVRCEYADKNYCTLSVAGVDGSNERTLASRERPIRIGAQDFSPDGKSIAFASGHSTNGGSDFQILRINLADGAESEITPKIYFDVKSLKWLPSGDELLLTAMETLSGKVNIWRVDAVTKEAVPLTKDSVNYGEISIDAAATRMISTQLSNSFRLIRTIDGKSTVLTAARYTTFAPDGRIVYVADDNNIWITNSDGTQQRQLTSDPSTEIYPQVSPDNRFIFFTSNRGGSNQVWRINADGSNQVQLTTKEGGYPSAVSHDGNWVFYRSGLRSTLWKVSTEGGGEVEVSNTKMTEPAISPDGTLAAYFKYNNKKWTIGITDLADGKQTADFDYADGKSSAIKIAWSHDNRTLLYVSKVNTKNSLWRLSIDTGKTQFVADLGGDMIADFSLAPDGNGFAFTRGKWLHDVVLVRGLK